MKNVTATSLDPLRCTWLARNLQQTPAWSEPSRPNYRHLKPVSYKPGYKPWCHRYKCFDAMITTSKSHVYRLLPMRHVHIKVRINSSASKCSPFVLKFPCTRFWNEFCPSVYTSPAFMCIHGIQTQLTTCNWKPTVSKVIAVFSIYKRSTRLRLFAFTSVKVVQNVYRPVLFLRYEEISRDTESCWHVLACLDLFTL